MTLRNIPEEGRCQQRGDGSLKLRLIAVLLAKCFVFRVWPSFLISPPQGKRREVYVYCPPPPQLLHRGWAGAGSQSSHIWVCVGLKSLWRGLWVSETPLKHPPARTWLEI
jgi:hypothetical protein